MNEITLNISGMSCSHCQNAVKNALMGVSGVEKAEVSLEKNNAEITYDATKVTVEMLKEAIEDEGYDVM